MREPLPKFIYDEVMNNVVTATRHSCYTAFVQEPYYAELPPALQSKLLTVCLSRIQSRFSNFFRKLNSQEMAARPIINRLLSRLKCSIQRVGAPLVEQGQEMDRVWFLYRGTAMVTRDFVSSIYGKTQLEIVELREGSWFGELAGLLQTPAYFGLRAGKQ